MARLKTLEAARGKMVRSIMIAESTRGEQNLVIILFEGGDELVIVAEGDEKAAVEIGAAAQRLSVNQLRVNQ